MSLFRGQMRQHLDGHKGLTERKDIVVLQPDEFVWIPLYASHSKEFDLLVKEGDQVYVGTKLAVCDKGLVVNIYSSVSGTVQGIEERLYNADVKVNHLKIAVDGNNTVKSDIPVFNAENATQEELVEFMKNAGIVGCGGASFPTYVKYNGVKDIDQVLINGVECEPYITADYKMIEKDLDSMIYGIQIMMKAANTKKATIAIKEKHAELINQVKARIASVEGIELAAVPDVYPMGWERTLIQEVVKKDYDRLTAEIGVIVNNATTAIKLAEAIQSQMPIVRKCLTFSGEALKNPVNVDVPVGMEVSEIIEKLGGYNCEEVRIIRGGPMMGSTAENDSIVIDRATNAITVLKHVEFDAIACLRCGSCTEHCPADLQPVRIANAVAAGNIDAMKKLNALSCIECGLCTYVCPSRIAVTENVRKAKRQLMALPKE